MKRYMAAYMSCLLVGLAVATTKQSAQDESLAGCVVPVRSKRGRQSYICQGEYHAMHKNSAEQRQQDVDIWASGPL